MTNKNSDIEIDDTSCIILGCGAGNMPFDPGVSVKSIELLDDPEYERITDINDVHEGDIFVANDGNQYETFNIDRNDAVGKRIRVKVAGLGLGASFWMPDSMFDYALRSKPKLPNKNGLWWDKDNALWAYDGIAIQNVVMSNGYVDLSLCAVDEAKTVFSLNDDWIIKRAPFRPAKAVDA